MRQTAGARVRRTARDLGRSRCIRRQRRRLHERRNSGVLVVAEIERVRCRWREKWFANAALKVRMVDNSALCGEMDWENLLCWFGLTCSLGERVNHITASP